MKAARKISTLVTVLLVLSGVVLAQEHHDGNLAERQKAPTVLGGTGLFNTFSTRTLCKGEFNFALFWNNYDRDPGDIDINQVPFNFTIGITNRWEMDRLGHLDEYDISPAVPFERISIERVPVLWRSLHFAGTGSGRKRQVGRILPGEWFPGGRDFAASRTLWYADRLPKQRFFAGGKSEQASERARTTDRNQSAQLLS